MAAPGAVFGLGTPLPGAVVAGVPGCPCAGGVPGFGCAPGAAGFCGWEGWTGAAWAGLAPGCCGGCPGAACCPGWAGSSGVPGADGVVPAGCGVPFCWGVGCARVPGFWPPGCWAEFTVPGVLVPVVAAPGWPGTVAWPPVAALPPLCPAVAPVCPAAHIAVAVSRSANAINRILIIAYSPGAIHLWDSQVFFT